MQLPVTRETGPELVDTEEVERLLCRVGTYDRQIARSVRREYASLPVEGRVVLDVGANIGAFSAHALDRGARLVVSIEPEASNLVCLRHNLARFGERSVVIAGCAAVEDGTGEIWLSTSGTNPGNTTQTQRRGRFSQSVQLHSMRRLLEQYQPQSIKLDCEGAEYDIGWPYDFPASVQDVVAEIHISGFGLAQAEALVRAYSLWRTTREPTLSKNLWHTIGAWSRG